MGVDVFDILAVIVGVWFSVRKLDAQGRQPSDFPHVPEDRFLVWQEAEVSAYKLGVFGCFSKVIADLAFTHWMAQDLPFAVARMVGAAIDLSWLFILVVTFVRTSRSRRQRRELGIVLGGFVAPRDEEEAEPDEEETERDQEEKDEVDSEPDPRADKTRSGEG